MTGLFLLWILTSVEVILSYNKHDTFNSKEVSCCSHIYKSNKENLLETSCGELYYRTFHIDEEGNSLFVGAMDRLMKIPLNNITKFNCEKDSLKLNPNSVANCVSKGKSEKFDCRNHIKVIQPIDNGRLYICGTNAHRPKDWIIWANLTHISRNEHIPGIGDGIGRCPFDPLDNNTAIWVKKGNPDDLPGLYSGSVAEFSKADTVIFRGSLYNYTTKRIEYPFKRTIKYDSKWLDKPNFVGSYDVGEYVLFFFRETALEYINCGKNIFSRVARVCKKDNGGKNILTQNWTTFLKARLNCSISGEFPFYFDEIQSVYKVPGDDSKYYAVFTTNMNGLIGSAICTFSQSSIEKAFRGRFKEQATSSSAWLPVLTSKVPEPRPGSCVNDTRTLPDNVLTFIQSHPLMDESVSHENNNPVFYKRDLILSHLVVDKVVGSAAPENTNIFTVYYAGSFDGHIYKVVEWTDRNGHSVSRLQDVIKVTAPEPIRAIEISRKYKSLYVSSDSTIKQMDLFMCSTRYNSCMRCSKDPYCGWNKDSGSCLAYKPGLLQDVMEETPGICDPSIPKVKMAATWGQSIHLGCLAKLPKSLTVKDVTWHHYSKEKGKYEIRYRPDKYVETSENGLVIMSLTESDSGRYDCQMGDHIIFSYNITVDSHRCQAPARTNDYQKVYSDWCHEFEKYKMAMKSWERKQAQCLSRNGSQNTHHNEIYSRGNHLL